MKNEESKLIKLAVYVTKKYLSAREIFRHIIQGSKYLNDSQSYKNLELKYNQAEQEKVELRSELALKRGSIKTLEEELESQEKKVHQLENLAGFQSKNVNDKILQHLAYVINSGTLSHNVVLIDRKNHVKAVSPSALELMGFSQADYASIEGKPYTEFISDDLSKTRISQEILLSIPKEIATMPGEKINEVYIESVKIHGRKELQVDVRAFARYMKLFSNRPSDLMYALLILDQVGYKTRMLRKIGLARNTAIKSAKEAKEILKKHQQLMERTD